MPTRTITYSQAISEALVQAMERDPRVFIFGLGVDDYKGIFGTTAAAARRFGPARVFDTPASENALTGIAIGAALNNKRPVLVHARHDFMFLALDQMINNMAKWKYVYGGKSSPPILIRAIVGKGWGQGPTHSQNLQAVCAHFPGLTVAVPATPYDVKGLILKALTMDQPVLIFESRALYDAPGEVPEEIYTCEFGRGRIRQEGRDITVVATSLMVPLAVKAADILQKEGISVEVIDPVTLQPFDEEIILESVRKTGRLICVDNDWRRCGFASEVAATVAEKGFAFLRRPIRRITWAECPCPVSLSLEGLFYPRCEDIIHAAFELMEREASYDRSQAEHRDNFMGPY